MSFSEKLKESAAALFDIDPLFWEEFKNRPDAYVKIESASFSGARDIKTRARVSVREFLQRYGTEAHRDIFGYDFWVDHAIKGIDPNKNYVFTDARFENELAKIKTLDGYNAQITRDDLINDDRHVSEVPPPMHLIDYQIINSYGLTELWKEVDEFVEFLKIESYVID